MKTKFALTFYYVSIGLLIITALGIIWRLVIWPPCTQLGNACVIEGWDVAGLAGTVLGVAATVLAILGAVAVAAWWTSLDKQVTKRVSKLYNRQKVEIDRTLVAQQEQLEKQSQERINKTIYEFEESITESFAAQGPLLAEPIAQKAMDAGKYPTFPFYMTKSYLTHIKQEKPLQYFERDMPSYRRTIFDTQFAIDAYTATASIYPSIHSHKASLENDIAALNAPNNQVNMELETWHRTMWWWKAAKDNQPKTPSLKPKDFDNVQKEINLYSTQMEKAERAFVKVKSDFQSLLSRLESLTQQN